MKILDAIRISHKGKYETLKVVSHGNYWEFNPYDDNGLREYMKARDKICEYKLLEKFLEKIKYI